MNCEIKEGKYSSDLQVHVKNSSEIVKSPTDIDATSIIADLPTDQSTVSQLPSIANYHKCL